MRVDRLGRRRWPPQRAGARGHAAVDQDAGIVLLGGPTTSPAERVLQSPRADASADAKQKDAHAEGGDDGCARDEFSLR